MNARKTTLALALSLLTITSSASSLDPRFQHLVHKAYTLQEQTMDAANWLYIGFAPRIQDPKRIKVVLSKQGFTMRVNFMMTPEEVADYPAYLKRRMDRVLDVLGEKGNVNIKQMTRFEDYLKEVDSIAAAGMNDFEGGFYFLSRKFPKNIRRKNGPDGRQWVEGNFVYPITVHETGKVFYTDVNGNKTSMTPSMAQVSPPANTYYTQTLDERRSAHYAYSEDENGYQERSHIQDHLFDGFPAFWFRMNAGTKGQGIHGPIRYSAAHEKNGVAQNDYLNDPQLWTEINPQYRFEVIRTANSAGCVRSEPMEMRHIFPSDPKLIYQIPIHIIDEIDQVDGQYVDVDYYIEHHMRTPNKRDWYLKHYITYEERQWAKRAGISVDDILDQKLSKTKVFPYLHPRVLELESFTNEFGFPIAFGDLSLMTKLNRAPQK